MALFRTRLNDIAAGLSVGAYLVVIPLLVPTLWNRNLGHDQLLAHSCVAALGVLWAVVASNLARTFIRMRRGQRQSGGFAWLAGAILSLSSFLLPTLAAAATPHQRETTSQHVGVGAVVGIPLALVAKKRRDELLQLQSFMSEESIDTAIDELRERNDGFLHALRHAIGENRSGLVHLDDTATRSEAEFDHVMVAIPIARDGATWTISFADLGSRLVVPDHFSQDDLQAGIVALHRRGGVLIGHDLVSTLRHLVLREHNGIVVVHVGAEPLDPEIAAQCVVASCQSVGSPKVMIRLLQPEATVEGVERQFDSDLRRKCIEMLSYLSVHPDYGVSGDRLRARVLGSRDLDASVRTLNNTASALRRSLGETEGVSRLAPVGPNGLYRVRDVACDVTMFFDLVERARASEPAQQRELLLEAISLVRGEPLVAEPRGYEWFLAEGHYARVLRTLEFAVATLLDVGSREHDEEIQWRARDAMGRFDPYHVLGEAHERAARTDRL